MNRVARLAFPAVVVALVLFVYAPSLEHVPRDDQISFLYESNRYMNGGLAGVVVGTISYPRSTHFAPGGSILFRPLFFALLALERWAWGDRLALWQATGILLHLLVLWNLRRLLRALHDDPLADLGVLFFAVLSLASETVVWHNVNGYLLFSWFLLAASHRLLLHLRDPDGAGRALPVAAGYFSLASFAYEFGAAAATAVAVGVFFYLPPGRRARTVRMLLLPVALYLGMNLLDAWARHGEIPRGPTGYTPHPFTIAASIRAVGTLLHFWIHGALFPFGHTYVVGQRPGLFFSPGFLPGGALAIPGRLLEIAALTILLRGAVVRISPSPRTPPERATVAAAAYFATLLAGYTLLVAAGRVVPRGEFYLHWNLPWAYVFWVLLLCLLAAGAGLARWGLGAGAAPSARRSARIAAILLGAVLVENALFTRVVNEADRSLHAPARAYLCELAHDVRARGAGSLRGLARDDPADRTGAEPFVVLSDGTSVRRSLFYSEALYGDGVRADTSSELR